MLSRYDPSGLSLRNAMDQLLTQSFVNPDWFTGTTPATIAAMNVYETNNGYEVDVSLPGVNPQDIDLTVQQNTLDIKGRFSLDSPLSPEFQQSLQSGDQSQQAQSQQAPGQQVQGGQPQQGQSAQSWQGQGGQSWQGRDQRQERYNILLQEIPSGAFERTITFPRPIDANNIHTHFENGILTMWVPVSEESRPRKINVQPMQGQAQPQRVSVQSS